MPCELANAPDEHTVERGKAACYRWRASRESRDLSWQGGRRGPKKPLC
jgi:hypothetical protein